MPVTQHIALPTLVKIYFHFVLLVLEYKHATVCLWIKYSKITCFCISNKVFSCEADFLHSAVSFRSHCTVSLHSLKKLARVCYVGLAKHMQDF